jgi:hypothetical protein
LILKLRVKMALNCFEVQYSDVEGAGFGCLQCSEGKLLVLADRKLYWTLFTSGFSFNIPTPKIVNALKQETIVRLLLF